MKYALKTTLAAAAAAISLAGASMAFAADNAGSTPNKGDGPQDTVITTDPATPDTTTTGSVTCDDQSTADQQNCIPKEASKQPHANKPNQNK